MFYTMSAMMGLLLAMASAAAAAPATGPGNDSVAASQPQKPGFHRLFFQDKIDGHERRVAFALFLPKEYDGREGNWPMVVTLCGAGEVGDNHEGLFVNGPISELNRNKELAKSANFIVLAPQCPAGLRYESKDMPETVLRMIQYVKERWRVDSSRVYLTGLSMGGTGAWHVMLRSPETFAAVAPISAQAAEPDKVAAAAKGMTVWIICGGADNSYTAGSRQMYQALQAKGVDVFLSEVPGEGHGAWGRYFSQTAFYDFLLLHRRGRKPPKARPIAEQLLAIGYTNPNSQDAKLADAFKTFLPYWQLINCGPEQQPSLKDDLEGRKNAFVTHPLDPQTPCRFLTTASVPKGKFTHLNLTVGHPAKRAWQLVVRADREDILRRTIGDAPPAPNAPPPPPAIQPASAWEDISIDLTRFAGQDIQLELLNFPAVPNAPAPAWWGKVEILSLDPPKPPPPEWPLLSIGFACAVLLYAAVRPLFRRRKGTRTPSS